MRLADQISTVERVRIAGAPEGFDALLLGDLALAGKDVLFVARDDVRMARMADGLAFFRPQPDRLLFPAWDCLPYDRVSPRAEIVAQRIDTLVRLAEPRPSDRGRIVLTTVAAVLQRIPPRATFPGAVLEVARGRRLERQALLAFVAANGYRAAETAREPGEFAVRGGIVDLFPPGEGEPLRLDFFGDVVDGIRTFDSASQRSSGRKEGAVLKPMSEFRLDRDAISRFRTGYRAAFAAAAEDDPLYEAVSAGRRHAGMEHWLPLFYDRLEPLTDRLPEAVIILDHQAEEARDARIDLVREYYEARLRFAADGGGGLAYNPLPPERLHLDATEWEAALANRSVGQLSPFAIAEGAAGAIDAGGRGGRNFVDVRLQAGANVFDSVREHVAALQAEGRRVVIAAYSAGSRDRLAGVLAEHRVAGLVQVVSWAEAAALPATAVAVAVLALDRGFTAPGIGAIAEQDVLGERLVRAARRRVRPENYIAEASALSEGDLVVHVEHGIGRYQGLATIEVAGAPHDCLRLLYEGGDKLFVPVENIEVLSRYGSEDAAVALDRLGGTAWQARKARLKRRIKDMAEALIKTAAARVVRTAATLVAPEGLFEEFCARFPYLETEDQARAIEETLADLEGGHPTDRLICGDVGFGKTEVALRAAFVAVLAGKQVAVVVPTTLLARQHFATFRQRFADLPVRVEQLSRLVNAATTRRVKEGLVQGTVDIVIGTHALLSKSVRFRDLGLVVVDEEQHFGVAHKERLKQLKSDVHVLTLTATPIPRTLQMALSGVRELSLIATPPIDRLAVRTFVLPFDPVIVREAILREHFRGGQSFYVCPRIEHLDAVAARVKELVPEVKVGVAHGRLAARALEATMAAFYDHAFDVLVSTNIIESGLDLPAVNTIVIHRADRFGLAQLYQLRGRVGRSKVRAYAYLTLPPSERVAAAAQRRLEVMQTLDSLGAGFALASHDLDIRGAGNLLGEEQSGHIREVGVELYQKMLEEAVAEARGVAGREAEEWSPQLSLGMPVRIPEAYVGDLAVRLGLYRRIARLATREEIDAFAAEMIDRFGPLPEEVENLLRIVTIKQFCRAAAVERVEAGPKGALLAFRHDRFARPDGLVAFLSQQAGTVRLRPDHKLVFMRIWDHPRERLDGVRGLVKALAEIAARPAAPAAAG